MAFSDKPREPRPPRRARPRQSLKMQAIGYLSRREYSRQELRAKLLDSLRKRAREDAALAAAAEAAARELAQAIAEQPSNGIDDAFAPQAAAPAPAPARVTRAPAGARARDVTAGIAPSAEREVSASLPSPASTRAALATLTRGDGGALPSSLRTRLDAVLGADAASPRRVARPDADSLSVGGAVTSRRDRVHVAAEVVEAGEPPAAGDIDVDGHEASSGPADADDGAAAELADPEGAVDQLLDWLVANKYLSETRFVESRVNARSRKQGTLRIKLELSRHGLAMAPEQAAALRETEFARAQALWQRKFGAVATDVRERARQGRFLAARGFAADVVRRVVGGMDED